MSTVQPRSPIVLQPAGWDQLDAVMGIMARAFDPNFGEAWTRAQCAGILPMHGVKMMLAGEMDRPLGFSLTRMVADEAELLLLAVAPEARRMRIGSMLMVHFIEQAQAFGASRLHLEVRDGNPAAHLYARHQFSIAGRRPNYYRGADGQMFDAITMARRI
jgi:ribosomal-protein-alanine N-acetyltransferase